MSLTIEKLQAFPLFATLRQEQLLLILACSNVVQKRSGQELFRQGDRDAHDIFLLQGAVRVVAADGREFVIQADTPRGRTPLARLRPRQYTALAQGMVEYLTVPMTVVDELSKKVEEELEIDFEPSDDVDLSERFYRDFLRDIKSRRFQLKCLPDTTSRLSHMIENEPVTLQQLVEMVTVDPVVAVRIMKAANNPAYWGENSCLSLEEGMARLGLATVQKLLASFIASGVFDAASVELEERMRAVSQRSHEISAISMILAEQTKLFDVSQAMLAGLVSTIGEIAVIQYAAKYPEIAHHSRMVQHLCETWSASIGKVLLEQWHFPSSLVGVVACYQEWSRKTTAEADLGDLVLLATWHSYIGKRHEQVLPLIHEMPALERLHLRDFTPEKVLAVLLQSKQVMNRLLNTVVA